MLYPVGMIPYTNMEPYRQLGEPEYCKFVSLLPKESIMAIKTGRVLAAAIPVGGLLYLDKLVEPIGKFGIATGDCSMSVLFFSRIPFTSLRKNHRIWLTNESASSVRLLYLLLGYKNGFDNIPGLSSIKGISDGELIIGDKALIRNRIGVQKPSLKLIDDIDCSHITDLAKLWYEIKGHPFVFARWVIRKDVPSILRKSIKQWLYSFKEYEEELVNKAIKVAAKTLKVDDCDMERYFKVIRRSLNCDDLFGQDLFIKSFRKHYREPLFLRNNTE